MTRKMKAKFQNTEYGLTQIERRERERMATNFKAHMARGFIFFSHYSSLYFNL